MNLLKLSAGILLFVTAMAAGSASATCSKASVTGVWGFQIGTAIGQFKADGIGNITAGTLIVNQAGTLKETFAGTYTVGSACTGSLSLKLSTGGTATANFVLDNLNKGAQFIDTTPGVTAEGPGASKGTVTCGLTGTAETFAALLLGRASGNQIAYVAQLILDGKGHVSGAGTFVVAGTARVTTIAGTYTESSSCIGNIHITPSGLSTLNFAFVVVNGGNELLLLETDSNASVAGNMQR